MREREASRRGARVAEYFRFAFQRVLGFSRALCSYIWLCLFAVLCALFLPLLYGLCTCVQCISISATYLRDSFRNN
jgi:hypothetical protein